jgi:hypothetical protein
MELDFFSIVMCLRRYTQWWGDTMQDVAYTINFVHPSTLFLSFFLPHAALSWLFVFGKRALLPNVSNEAISLLGGIGSK